LLTSRIDYADTFPQYELDVIDNYNDLYSIMTYYYKSDVDEENEIAIENIIAAMLGHTMALELIAKHMQALEIIPVAMYDLLAQNGITAGNIGKVRGFKDGNLKSNTAYAHIAALFNIFGLSEDMKQVLRFAALIGPTPLYQSFFMDIMDMSELPISALDSVIQHGWIQLVIITESPILILHPLISEVLCEELKPDIEHCEDVIYVAAATLDDLLNFNADQRKLEITWLDHTAHNIHGNSDFITFFLNSMNHKVYMAEHDYKNAEWCNLRILDILETLGLQETFKLQYLNCYLFLQEIAEKTNRPELQAQYLQKIHKLDTPDALINMQAKRYAESFLSMDYTDAIQAASAWLQIASENNQTRLAAMAYHKLGLAESELSHHDDVV